MISLLSLTPTIIPFFYFTTERDQTKVMGYHALTNVEMMCYLHKKQVMKTSLFSKERSLPICMFNARNSSIINSNWYVAIFSFTFLFFYGKIRRLVR
ncbi:hypothetical protein RV14_GL000253 [Enterococcus ratti]|uniref:Uncharacterized protein n=1 Tax=Enterococcus ratti TaxID=150033 RepID=A0A1L8WL21_9ENTE|nr:hypothetical protein RV14_GL000253 [Enterococcus ratti]